MSNIEEKDDIQPRARKVLPNVKLENTDQEAERKPYNQGYSRLEGNNYERRPYNNRQSQDNRGYNNRGGYNDNRQYYGGGDRNNNRRQYDNGGGYSNNNGYYGNNRGYGNRGYGNRPQYDNESYGYNYPPQRYNNNYNNGGGRAYSATPAGEGFPSGDAPVKKRRPRVGDSRMNQGGGYNQMRQPYGNAGGRAGNNFNNRRSNNNRRPQQQGNNYNPNAKYSKQKQLKYKEMLTDPNEPIRLNKFLANAGVCSRREADAFIEAGDVKVNDVVITELGTKITRQDKVTFKDKEVHIESKVYILLNKPKNCVTTSDDPQERLTVMDLVKNACSERIYPVGRLDRNTTGVLLLTNDGDLASKLTHPAFKKKKIYHVWLDKPVAVEDMEKIANGLELEDGEIHADAISYAHETDRAQVGIEIHSGRNRIVRRIFESLGYHVTKLDRVYFAGLTKKNLSRGKWRYLNEKEVNALRMGAFE